METTIVYWGYMRMTENKMETAVWVSKAIATHMVTLNGYNIFCILQDLPSTVLRALNGGT